jgi:hypothetical protein
MAVIQNPYSAVSLMLITNESLEVCTHNSVWAEIMKMHVHTSQEINAQL